MNVRAPHLFVIGVLIGACVSQATSVTVEATPPAPRTFTGTVVFQARTATPTGASRAMQWRPVRLAKVRGVDAAGEEIASTTLDEEGRFVLEGTDRVDHLEVVAHIHEGEWDLAVTTDSAGESDHRVVVPASEAPLEVRIDDGQEAAGAFHILDSILMGSRAVEEWTGQTLPPFFAYWSRGVTTNWSFYLGDRGSGRYSIELLGGEPGQQNTTDTDEHDEMIVLHEFGHFVMDVLSSDSSYGGQHPRGFLILPGLAWEEARATWFATMVLKSPMYLDTIGVEPTGRLRISHDLERGDRNDVRGVGSESGIAEILWDLADGTEALPDQDQDGIALGPAAVLQGMINLGREPGAHPAITTFLQHLVESEGASLDQVKHVLELGGHPNDLLPGGAEWPVDIEVPGKVSDKIDGLSDPAPSGGPPRPVNGQDAIHVYRFQLTEPGRVVATLEIFGSGRAADHTDLDLEIRDIRADLIDSSRGEGPLETLSRHLDAGWYVVHVRDGGNGNRAGYELRLDTR
ncbi:MAG: hypothetical protein AAGE52_21870 [Myxococcota bacterium]